MQLTGRQRLGSELSAEGRETFRARDPRTGVTLDPPFLGATAGEVERALALAERAHPAFERRGRAARAALLERAAGEIEELGPALLERASAETGLGLPRLESERARTTGQLRLFARVAREGAYLDLRIDHADPARASGPKPDLRSMARALGPVAVFGASNFPLAFSVAGGDTASALAAGCPVVVKAHPNHPGTSEAVGGAIARAVAALGLPEGTFSLVQGAGDAVGARLVGDPRTRAVAFTGSLRGGRALFDLAARRERPIPVFAEMGSTNPVFVLPARLAEAGAEIAAGLAQSVTLGVGQFCTKPGLVVLERSAAAEGFLGALERGLAAVAEGALLHEGIRRGFEQRLDELASVPGVEVRRRERASGPCGARAALLRASAETFLAHPTLGEEVFGPCTIVVECERARALLEVARALGGQLTSTVHAAGADGALACELLAILEQTAGRVLFGGYPTGVEIVDSMVHGGPYPATTDSRFTSVGSAAIARFVRPVAYQNVPPELLPEELRDDAAPGPPRRVDGVLRAGAEGS